MIPEGRLSELMAMVEPEIYIQHIHMNSKNKKMIYVKPKKALYR